MSLSPAELQQISVDVCRKAAVEYKDSVLQALDEGWLIWSVGTPKERLSGYIQCTWPDDYMFILTDDYPELYAAGVMPALRALIEWDKVTQPEPDGKGGVVIPEPSDMRPFAWGLWLLCPSFVFKRFAQDFRELLKAEQEKVA